jgi:hypothetical protein
MNKEFAPSREAFLVRLVWLTGPVVLVVALDRFEMVRQPHQVLNIVLVVGVILGVIFAVWLQGTKLRFQNFGLVITDFLGEHTYVWRLMDHPVIETKRRWILPSQQIFSFGYKDKGEVRYWLSELSELDRERVINLLQLAFPQLHEIEM